MSLRSLWASFGATLIACTLGACTAPRVQQTAGLADTEFGRYDIRSVPVPEDIIVTSATYIPSGSVLVEYVDNENSDSRQINLATIGDDGAGFRPFFSARLPERPLDNGIRQMAFPDNRRIFLGDFVIECSSSLETCDDAALLPVEYPAEVSSGDHISHRWSEIIIGPDNRHIAWTTLLADYSAVVFTGDLVREGAGYTIRDTHIISNIDLVKPDPAHKDGVLPVQVRGGEVKQFVAGGEAISVAGMTGHDLPDSVVLHLSDATMEPITSTPGYTETTIFSPDERLGVVMSTRFSQNSDPAVLGLLPRPYPDSLKINLNMLAYTYAVTGVRRQRGGNIGPVLIDVEKSKSDPDYLGTNLNSDPEWVYSSPMSWHPGGTKAMWMEGRREGGSRRIQIVELADYTPRTPVPSRPWPAQLAESSADLSIIPSLANRDADLTLRVYGKVSGHLDYRRKGYFIEKTYAGFSDDGKHVYKGFERMEADPRANSTYTAAIDLTGEIAGAMHLTMTFGSLGGKLPARIDFSNDESGNPTSRGYASYGGKRLDVADLVP